MGCGFSVPDGSAVTADQLLELAPQRNSSFNDTVATLNKAVLLAGLQHVAEYLARNRANITVIAVGGAVNTIHLGTRETTHDLDFYNENLRQNDYQLLLQATQHAMKKVPDLQAEWFNNHTVLFIPKNQRRALTEDALQQGEIVFRQPGLTVLAAPWHYAFCAKLDRLSGRHQTHTQPYDVSDAVAYLRRYLEKNSITCIQRSVVEEWAQKFDTRAPVQVLDQVNNLFKRHFQRDGIDMSV
ncbi:hypothetical protein LOZ53_004800 [Ophidiomyces ophidiicola]|nr:hypothetical protein LOZ53_004800 [Ophidiomyces ophidiicola]